jgi:hypothetical protein
MGIKKPHTGELRSFVTFQTNTNKGSLGGGFLDGYANLVTVKCKMEPVSGDRVEIFGAVGQSKLKRVICRFHPDIDNNLPNLRAIINNEKYTIQNHDYLVEGHKTHHVFEVIKFS